jgi:hypothetical protein
VRISPSDCVYIKFELLWCVLKQLPTSTVFENEIRSSERSSITRKVDTRFLAIACDAGMPRSEVDSQLVDMFIPLSNLVLFYFKKSPINGPVPQQDILPDFLSTSNQAIHCLDRGPPCLCFEPLNTTDGARSLQCMETEIRPISSCCQSEIYQTNKHAT